MSLSNSKTKMNSAFAEGISKKHHGVQKHVSPLFGDCYVLLPKEEIFLISMDTYLHSRYWRQVAFEQ